MDNLIQVVKAHALAHYETAGWDFVVECWDDRDILSTLTENNCLTPEQAIKVIGEQVGIQNEHRAEILATIF